MGSQKVNADLEKYLPLVDFLAEVLGKDSEIVLQDLTDLTNSVVAIRNSHVTGRGVGAPATNFVLKTMNNMKYADKNYIANYNGSLNDKLIKSSTFFIKNDKKQVIGMLCINSDMRKLSLLRNYLDEILYLEQDEAKEENLEYFSKSTEELIDNCIESALKDNGVTPERLLANEKIDIVKRLNDEGVFLIKGSVSHVASKLQVSEATLYRYLHKIRMEEKDHENYCKN